MIEVHDPAREYLQGLIEKQDMSGAGLRMVVSNPGTPSAECELSFCTEEDRAADDQVFELKGFTLYVDAASAPFLNDAEIDFEADPTGGQLVVRAPNIRGEEPQQDASLSERVQYVLDSEINPSVASHGGRVSLVGVSEAGEVTLEFGGGCHGCGMVSVTLKEGVEKTLRTRIPEVLAVRDVTDHASGENPYY